MKNFVGANITYRLPFQVAKKQGTVVSIRAHLGSPVLVLDNGDELLEPPSYCWWQPHRPTC